MSKEYMNDGSLSEKWKYRFNFYDQHGFPGFWGATPEYKAVFKALKVRQRLTIQMNFIAFFCSWIYLFVLGLWKKAIIVLLLGILSLFVGALIGVKEGANKQVISSQADSLIKISRIWADFF
ncbi:DUF2628 domain-containing protein, partial [Escherichia coli]